MVNEKASLADTNSAEGIMRINRLKYIYYGWPLLLLSLFSAGCTEILYFRTWRRPPPSSYVEPGPPKTAEEVRNPFYSIDCAKGVTCLSPDEEKTGQKDGLLFKECLWKNVPYKNGQPGLLWLTFSKKGDGCWQLHQE
jgi:hypothetical protein